MGADLPKQFVPVAGKPVLMHTLLRLAQAVPEAQLVLALPYAYQTYWEQLCRQYAFEVKHRLVHGGQTRFHSVRNALDLIPDVAGVVGVHDGVRPFVSQEVVRNCLQEAWTERAVVPVVPVVDTLRKLTDQGDSRMVCRDAYYLVQTPQAFRIEVLKRAYDQPYSEVFTDDASVVEAMGVRINLVKGNYENIKLTTPNDLKYAEFLCQA